MLKKIIRTGIEKKGIEKIAYSIISTDPIIIMIPFDHWEKSSVNDLFSEILKDQRAYFIILLYWTFDTEYEITCAKRVYLKRKTMHPKHEIIFMCNYPKQYNLFKKFNLPRVYCNQNAFVDENIYPILPKEKKKYDAIYIARALKFKRHYLARKIENLSLITHDISNKEYFNQIREILSKAKWLNYTTTKEYRYLEANEVNKCLNQAKTGLCLSAAEGAMYASVEYMLCGLPIISTKSKGGRDVFFDEAYVKIVDDSPDAVNAGVREMIERNVPPNYIRTKTLEKMGSHRERFIALIQKIYDKESVNRDFKREWNEVFINKMLHLV